VSDQLTRLLSEFDTDILADAGMQLDDTLLCIAENTVLFWAGLANAISTFQSTEELEDYKRLRRDLVEGGLVSEKELQIDALTLLRAVR
jgi:hypothetical protein